MRKWIKLNEVLTIMAIILLVTSFVFGTLLLVKSDKEIVPQQIQTDLIQSIELVNITTIIKEEIISPDGCFYARTPGHIKQCLEKYG